MVRIKIRWLFVCLLVAIFIFSCDMATNAQSSIDRETSPAESSIRSAVQSIAQPTNIEAESSAPTASSLRTKAVIAGRDGNGRVKLGDYIKVEVEGLSRAVSKQELNPQELVIFLEGYALSDVHGELVGDDLLAFKLDRTDESQEAWNSIIGGSARFIRKAEVSVGFVGQQEFPTEKPAPIIDILVLGSPWLLIYIPFLFLILFLFFRFGVDGLRGSGSNGTKQSFSLGRTQMAWWFFLIIASFGFIYSITGDYTNIVTSQAMVLLGIGAGTGVGAALIDESKSATVKGNKSSQNFFQDILTDTDGVSFDRFQIFIWTITLGLIFVFEVLKNLKMPEFDSTLLILQGISAGTYLGFKAQKQPSINPESKG